MKNLIFFFLLISVFFSKAQLSGPVQYHEPATTGKIVLNFPDSTSGTTLNKLFVPPYPSIDTTATSFIAPGQVFTTVITNNSSHSVSLYPYLNRAGMENIAWGDSFLLAYLRLQIVGMTDTDAIRLELVQKLATKIEKTDLYSHGQVLYNPNDSNLYAKQNSLMGALNGTYQKQCSNYIQNAIAILVSTGYFNYSNIVIVHLINHTTCQFLYRGSWAFADMDPLEPFFMIIDTENANGFASAMDIYNNQSLITPDQHYYFVNDSGDSINLANPTESIQQYRNRFNSVNISMTPYTNVPLSISGIILPAGAKIITEYTTPYILSPELYSILKETIVNNIDSVYIVLAQILGVSVDSAIIILSTNKLSLDYTTKNWQQDYRGITPVINIVLPETVDTIQIGGNKPCLNFCGYVLASTTTISLLDSSFYPGESPEIWSISGNNGNGQSISAGSVQYLSNKGFIPAHPTNSDTITVSYNPRVINFGTGFQLGYISGDSISTQTFLNDSLVSFTSTINYLPNITLPHIDPILLMPGSNGHHPQELHRENQNKDSASATSLPEVKTSSINIYPNPASNILNITLDNKNYLVQIYNISGQLILKRTVSGNDSIDISAIASGTYICNIINGSQANIYQKELVITH